MDAHFDLLLSLFVSVCISTQKASVLFSWEKDVNSLKIAFIQELIHPFVMSEAQSALFL